MSIKSLAHLAHQRITSVSDTSFKRTHFYELVAATYGYNSYAAFGAEAFLSDLAPSDIRHLVAKPEQVSQRCTALGYTAEATQVISTHLRQILSESGINAVRMADFVRALRENDYDDDLSPEDEPSQSSQALAFLDPEQLQEKALASPILLESLQTVAQRGTALAHYALALVHGPNRYDEDVREINPYWHRQRQAGKELVGVQIEWADAYEKQESNKKAYEFHLRASARLGCTHALIDLARAFSDPSLFESRSDLAGESPRELVELAQSLGRPADARTWLIVAAEGGDTDAMRELIERYDFADRLTCWQWMYLAQLFEVDLTEDRHYAIHENGSAYDDDVGGPMFVDGEDGITLEPLPPEDDIRAQQAARDIYDRYRDRQKNNLRLFSENGWHP